MKSKLSCVNKTSHQICRQIYLINKLNAPQISNNYKIAIGAVLLQKVKGAIVIMLVHKLTSPSLHN